LRGKPPRVEAQPAGVFLEGVLGRRRAAYTIVEMADGIAAVSPNEPPALRFGGVPGE